MSKANKEKKVKVERRYPNQETIKAIENSRCKRNLQTYASSEELFKDLGL
jgi:antitoxin component of RelBE/YafQ-DinJ toxin-antitoxin module